MNVLIQQYKNRTQNNVVKNNLLIAQKLINCKVTIMGGGVDVLLYFCCDFLGFQKSKGCIFN